MPSKYSRSRHAVKRSYVNSDLLYVMDSFKDHRGGVCLVKVMNPSTKPVVDAQAPNTILWLRVGVTVWHTGSVTEINLTLYIYAYVLIVKLNIYQAQHSLQLLNDGRWTTRT